VYFPYLTRASCSSSAAVKSWGCGCAGLPSLGVKTPGSDVRGRSLGYGPTINEDGAGC
jgi:hypothetical protein